MVKSLLMVLVVSAGAAVASANDMGCDCVGAAPAPAPVALYTCVKIEDPDHIAPCAVSKIVEVQDPCNPCGKVCVEICVPPCGCPEVKCHGDHVHYDYGKYAVEIKSKKGKVVIDYDD